MNIIDFCPYYPPHIGGVESYARELHDQLLKTGKVTAITVFTPQLPFNTASEEQLMDGLTVIRYPAVEMVLNFPIGKFWSLVFWKKISQTKKQKFDLVLTHTRFFPSAFLALIYAKLRRTKFIHIEHGSDFVQSASSVVSKVSWFYDQTMGRLVIKGANEVISISGAVELFIKKVYKRKTTTILRGVIHEAIEGIAESKETKALYKDKIIISFVGRLIEGKGVIDLLQAFSKVATPNLVLFLIGDGPQKKELETLVKQLGLTDNVVFWGFQQHDRVIGLLKISDILVNPSYTEGLPTTVIEAAICKVAVIATDVGGTKQIITDCKSGLLIDPRDQKVLVEKLHFFISRKEAREDMGLQAYKDVKETFDWQKSSARFLTIFTSVLSKKR